MSFQRSSHRICILILGMHRSGTSCLAGSLQKRGVFLGQVHEVNPHNRKGNRENQRLVDLNTKILQYNHADWDKPPSGRLLWNASHSRELERVRSDFDSVNRACWGFKDPRTLLTLPFWISEIKRRKFVGTVRRPMLVARSLQARNGLSIPCALELWLAYNARLIQLVEQNPFPIVSFDAEPDEYIAKVDAIAAQLGLPKTSNDEDDFYDQKLINREEPNEAELPAPVRILYDKIMAHAI